MAIDNFDLQGWLKEQQQGPFNKKALKENIMGYADLNSYNSIREEEEEDMMDIEDDWYDKPEVDDTPDEDAIDAMAMKQAKKAAKSIKGLNPDKDIQDLLYGDDDDDLYEGMGMSPEDLDRMEGVVNTKHLQAFKQIFKSLVGEWMNASFDQEDIVNYISGIGGFSTSQPFYNQSDDLEDETSNDAAYSSAIDSIEIGDDSDGGNMTYRG